MDVMPEKKQSEKPPTCHACAHCGTDPSDPKLVCWDPANKSMFGIYIDRARAQTGHCGPDGKNFKQHPHRNADGTLR